MLLIYLPLDVIKVIANESSLIYVNIRQVCQLWHNNLEYRPLNISQVIADPSMLKYSAYMNTFKILSRSDPVFMNIAVKHGILDNIRWFHNNNFAHTCETFKIAIENGNIQNLQ